ncbi:MAG: extracellular solute-binding protein [Oscillospiraceae bacterium]
MKKILSAVMAVLLIVTTFAACGAPAATSKPEESKAGESAATTEESKAAPAGELDQNEDGTINNPEAVKIEDGNLSFWSLFGGGDGVFMDQIIKDYNAGSPTKAVQSVMLVWGEYYTKLQTAVSAKKGPDIGVSHASKLAELVDQGVIDPIDDYLKELGVDLNTIYSKEAIESVTFDGKVYAVPLDTHAEVMFYNKDILTKAGVKFNAEGGLDIKDAAGFKALLDQVKGFIPEGGSTITMANQGDDPYRIWWATYFQMGGTPLVSEDGKTATLDKAIAGKAAEYVKSLFDEGYILPGIDDSQAFFQSGKAAFAFNGTWGTGAFESTKELNFGAMPFPSLYNGSNACWADAHTFILPVKPSRSPEDGKAAVEFMLGASGEKGGATWAKSGQVPSNSKVIESAAFLDLPYRKDYKSVLTTAVFPTKSVGFGGIKTELIDALNAFWLGDADTAATSDSLNKAIESNLS